MNSAVLSKAIDKMDDYLEQQNNTLSTRVNKILNDLVFIERQLWKRGDSIQHLMHVEDLIGKARLAIGS